MHIPVDPASSQPLYEQVRSALAEQILAGELPAGTALPSIRALARDLRVSVITITRAYTELVAEDLVISRQGRGVFVRELDPGALRSVAEQRLRETFADAAREAVRAEIPPSRVHDLLEDALHAADGSSRNDPVPAESPAKAERPATPEEESR